MKFNLFRILGICVVVAFIHSCIEAQKPQYLSDDCPWDVERLSETPEFEVIFEEDGVQGIIYKGLDYRGKSKDIFAYYANPATLAGESSEGKKYPAVVCVHGGGGQAFEQWVRIWAKRGYAAISMDMRGYGKDRVQLSGGYQEGPEKKMPTFISHDDQSEDWFYHAVSDVVLAHSLILSFPEVEAKKTAITGISWGGIITTLVSGLDSRFKAGVPVYGCGYLFEEGSMAPQIEEATELANMRWHTQYDPSLYVKDAKMPMLFVNGTNDAHFFVDQWSKTANLVDDKRYSMRLRMIHGHNKGWAPEEIYAFVDNILGVRTTATPEFERLQLKDGVLSCRVRNLSEGDRVSVIYTKTPTLDKESEWEEMEVALQGDKLTFEIDDECRACYVSVDQKSEAHYSSKVLY